MPDVIPLKDFGIFSQQVSLDGVPYVLIFKWNTRFEYWMMEVQDTDQNILLSGIKVVLQYPLTGRYGQNYDFAQGELYLQDNSNDKTKVQRNDFVNRLLMVYYTEAEIA